MENNFTIDKQLNHRSIRKFKDQNLSKDQLETLYKVFSQTPTSMFMQNATLIHITDEKKKAKIAEIRAVMDDDNMTVKAQDAKIEKLRGELKLIDQDIRQLRRDNEKEFVSILTPEQKVKYAQIKEEGKKHFRKHRMPQGPENFRHRPPVNDHRFKPTPKKS